MSDKIAQSFPDIDPFSNSVELSSESVSRQLDQFEIKFIKVQTKYTANGSYDIQLDFDQIQNMLTFAKDNLEKGFVNVSKSCLKLAENYLANINDW